MHAARVTSRHGGAHEDAYRRQKAVKERPAVAAAGHGNEKLKKRRFQLFPAEQSRRLFPPAITSPSIYSPPPVLSTRAPYGAFTGSHRSAVSIRSAPLACSLLDVRRYAFDGPFLALVFKNPDDLFCTTRSRGKNARETLGQVGDEQLSPRESSSLLCNRVVSPTIVTYVNTHTVTRKIYVTFVLFL